MTDLVTFTAVVSSRPKRALGHINNNYALVQRSPPIFDIPFAAHVLHLFFSIGNQILIVRKLIYLP